MRVIGWSWMAPCAMPPSPESMMWFSSLMIVSGDELATGRMATDLDRSQSTSTVLAASMAARRSEAVPVTMTRLVPGSVFTEPGRLPKPSSSLPRLAAGM